VHLLAIELLFNKTICIGATYQNIKKSTSPNKCTCDVMQMLELLILPGQSWNEKQSLKKCVRYLIIDQDDPSPIEKVAKSHLSPL
jgi:hypothetical protein